MPKSSESDLSRSVQKELVKLGAWVIRLNSGMAKRGARFIRLAEKGTPDLLVLQKGAAPGFLELKTDTGTVSEDQIAWHERARSFGINIAVVTSVKQAIETVKSWVSDKEKNVN